MGPQVILDEAEASVIDDPKLMKQICIASAGKPAWIGSRRPETNLDVGVGGSRVWASVHYRFYLNFVEHFMERRGRVLDIGCGNGQNTAMLGRYSEYVEGIDPDVEFASKYNAGEWVKFIKGRFPENINRESRYDYIFCVETIEHVPYDEQEGFIGVALGLLAPNGMMFITTPNEQSAGGDHKGIWTNDIARNRVFKFHNHVVCYGFFSNANPVGICSHGASHRMMVLAP